MARSLGHSKFHLTSPSHLPTLQLRKLRLRKVTYPKSHTRHFPSARGSWGPSARGMGTGEHPFPHEGTSLLPRDHSGLEHGAQTVRKVG